MTYASLTADLVRVPHQQRAARRLGRGRGEGGRRALVLTDDGARNPFRASLPPHATADVIDIPAERLWALTRDDVRGFASTYVTVTAAVLAFIL